MNFPNGVIRQSLHEHGESNVTGGCGAAAAVLQSAIAAIMNVAANSESIGKSFMDTCVIRNF
jgi:formiminotetrahydrofolate cyclodeaminase